MSETARVPRLTPGGSKRVWWNLTAREIDVLECAAGGLGITETATRLHLRDAA